MSNYNDNWKAFVNETKEMSGEQLQEYISDIRSAATALSSQSGQGTQYSGLQTPTNKQLKQIARRKKQRAMKQKLMQGLAWLKKQLDKFERTTTGRPSLARLINPEIRERLFKEVTKDLDKASKEIDSVLDDGLALINTMIYIRSDELSILQKKHITGMVQNMMRVKGIPANPRLTPRIEALLEEKSI
tara:strand:- start:2153 stop:2716 length:564 start_codon:yes stop_codon:yes gene_type:complete